MVYKVDGSNEIGLYLEGSIFFPFLKIGFSFATLQAFGKTPCEIERLQSVEMSFAGTSVLSSKSLLESLSTPAASELSIIVIFQDFFSDVLFNQE